MNFKNKFMLAFLSFIMLFLLVSPNLKADLDSENIKNAQILADAGIIVNNSNNPKAYNINSSITRREMLKVMLNLAGVTPSNPCEQTFSDLPTSDWGCGYAQMALKLGYISPNKNFRPNDLVSKSESLKMIFKAKNISVTNTNDWRVGYMQKAVELGFSEKFNDFDNPSKRNFVFGVGAKVISKNISGIKVSNIQEKIFSYEKPKVVLNFASNMNKTSVLSNLKVYPEISYTTNWLDDKNLELVISDLVREDTQMLVNVLDNALTSSGTKLENTYVKKFKIDGEALIEFVTPNGAINDLNQNITVRFSKPIVSLTNLDNQPKCPIEISPEIPGKCVWITTQTFQFRPEKGFPMGGKYQITIPSGIDTITGDKTINSKSFEIITPEFNLVSDINSLNADEKLKFVFNDEVNLDSFKNNFNISSISNADLIFSYYKGENDLEENKNIIEVYKKNGNWGYNKNLTYTIFNKLTSSRGNIGLKNTISRNITTNEFLISYSPVIFLDENAKEKYSLSNIKQSQNNSIITKNNPSILLNFYKEVDLDKNMFISDLPFELNYVKISNYENGKSILKQDKKQVVITFSGNINNNFKLVVKGYGDRKINFQTKQNNSIISYKQINYKKACIETQNDMGYINNFKSFEFDKYGKIDYMYSVNEWTKDSDCKYIPGKNRYLLNTRLNPSSDYKLNIKSTLLDSDNYPLDKDYSFSFSTPKALNEDKSVSVIDGRNLILVPNTIKPLTIGVQTVNLSEIQAKICVGDIDVLSNNYLKNPECVSKVVNVENLGFKPNISIIDLEKTFSKDITKKYITVEISKISQDKTDSEVKYESSISKASFIVSDVGVTIKSAKNNILWLHNFSSGANLTNEIQKIESYKKEADYSVFGAYKGEKISFDKEISFISKEDGLYELGENNFNILNITLKSGEKIILDNIYAYYSENQNIYNYIFTDKPIYKKEEKVQISGISRKLNASGYVINTKTVNIVVRDNQYKEILNKNVTPNSLGAFDLSFDLKSDAKLGNYTIQVGDNSLGFAVEEYEKPDFKVELKSKNDNYLFGETAKIDVLGEYYIGLPLSAGDGKYNLTSSEFYFDGGKTTGYTFGEQNNFWWGIRPMSSKMGGIYYGQNNTIEKSGNFVLGNDGKAVLNIPLEESDKDKVYTLSSTITDPNTKKSISSNTSFKAIRSKTFLGMKFDKYYYAFGDKANIGFVSVDIDGNKLPSEKFNYKVYKVDYKYDENNYNYETNENLVIEKNISTNALGVLNESFTFDKYGEYRFEITNGRYKTTKTIYVSGGDILRPIDAQNNIEIQTDLEKYKVGEKAKINISSPVVGVKALLTIEKLDEVLDYKIIDIDSYSKEIELDIKKEYLPNFNVGVYIIKDVKTSKELPEYYIGNKEIKIDLENVKLNASIKLDKTSYLPGDSGKIELYITDNNGKAINGEIALSVIDKSLLALKENKTDILNYFYFDVYNSVQTFGNLKNLIKKIEFKVDENSNRSHEEAVGGSFGMVSTEAPAMDDLGESSDNLVSAKKEMSSVGKTNSNETKLRTEFKDQAFYKTKVVVINGKAVLDVPSLPDNLTTWVISGYAYTSDTKVGNFEKEFKVQKELSILPQVPRFFLNGDKTEVGGLVVNNTNSIKEVKVSLDMTNVTSTGTLEKIVSVPANSSKLVSFDILILNPSPKGEGQGVRTDISLKAVSGDLEDSIKISKPIYPSKTSQYVFTNGMTENLSYEEKLDFGNVSKNGGYLEVSLGATILTNLTKNLDKVLYFPGDDLSSKINFLKNVIALEELYKKLGKTSEFESIELFDYKNKSYKVKEVLSLVKDDIKNYVQADDGLSYYKDCDRWWGSESCSDMNITGNFLNLNLVVSGVDNKKLLEYYKNALIKKIEENKKYNIETTNIADFLPIALYKDSDFVAKYFKPEAELSNLEKLDYIKLYNLIGKDEKLDTINRISTANKSSQYLTDLKNAILFEARGAVLPAEKSFSSFDNSVATAKMIQILIDETSSVETTIYGVSKNTDTINRVSTQNLVRFLISNRDENGNYYTYDFSEVINAINKYLQETRELENIDFTAKTYLNSKEIMISKFGQSNKFEIDKKTFNFEDYLVAGDNSLGFEKNGTGKLYYDVGVRYYLPVSKMNSREEGITVSRNYYNYDDYKSAYKKECITPWWYYDFGPFCFTKKVKNIDNISFANKGDYIVGEIEISLDKERTDIIVNDYLPAGAEILNTNFNTTSSEVKDISGGTNKSWWQSGFDLVEQKDDRVYLYAKHLQAGTYKYTYVLKANYKGTYNLKPATAELLEKPEIWGSSSGGEFEVR